MNYKSQNNEAETVIKYFNGRIGNLLDIGAQDGEYLSNSYDLIQLGWSASLLEPLSGTFEKIVRLHKGNDKVSAYNFGIDTSTGVKPFYASGGSVINVLDKSLLDKWGYEMEYETTAQFYTWTESGLSTNTYNFITMDCEGLDFDILTQMDLTAIGCECICVEQGNDPVNYERIKKYCADHGLTKELLYNFENVILAK